MVAGTTLRARVLSFHDEPDASALAAGADPTSVAGVDYQDDAVVVLRDGRIDSVLPAVAYEREGGRLDACEDLRDALLIPGMIDTHIHYSQMAIVGSYGTQLLDWLDRYAFPAEIAFADAEHAAAQAALFFDRLFARGTTSALVFTTVHPQACDALFAEAQRRRARIVAGKVLMNRNAPSELRDADDGMTASMALIERWHGSDRLAYAVTPRFALSCTADQLAAAGEIVRRCPDVYVHSHISEHPDEVAATLSDFPEAANYADVYDRFGLLTEKSVYAHGIHLSDAELRRFAEAGASVAFCPSSNLFLGSGLLDLARLRAFGVGMGVATDIGGGTDYSMLSALGDGYKVCQLNGQSWHPLSALYTATLGNARVLGLQDAIGRVAAGFEADFCVLRPNPHTLLGERLAGERGITDTLFAAMIMDSENAIERTYVAGDIAWQRPAAGASR
ncbi:MAG: guanine deaminase [Pseudomonadota bacterium]